MTEQLYQLIDGRWITLSHVIQISKYPSSLTAGYCWVVIKTDCHNEILFQDEIEAQQYMDEIANLVNQKRQETGLQVI